VTIPPARMVVLGSIGWHLGADLVPLAVVGGTRMGRPLVLPLVRLVAVVGGTRKGSPLVKSLGGHP
jgi:hypothetical protein